MRRPAASFGIGIVAAVVFMIACRQGDPAIDPKAPPNSPLPKIERPDDQVVAPKAPKDGG